MLILLSALSLFLSSHTPSKLSAKTSLTIDVQNVRSRQGSVYVALFRPGKDFPQGRPIEGKKLSIGGKSVQTTFTVEPGSYAVAVYHDENGNGKMDKRVFGIPKEPYGFSNNFRPTMSAPKFSDCQFSVGDAGKAISIKLSAWNE
ncbi:DUF2141 domain-containing protein [Spirosoma taeanense]|uniref:DUF2141 domain-containing protein n=1 Tax=Spirosoma taeanense TaxID=2735870 RepID=A0A6M5YA14_9BACT|nr:DUF2141 domain-containing protein [Spirosoma taeanense]QJW91058.1 DUF2141 domain-containing protein [Spirosoma taeanense]